MQLIASGEPIMKIWNPNTGWINDIDTDGERAKFGSTPRFLVFRRFSDGHSTSDFGHTTGATCGVLPRL